MVTIVKGLTLLESLVSLVLLSLILTFGIGSLGKFIAHIEVEQALVKLKSSVQHARLSAMAQARYIRFERDFFVSNISNSKVLAIQYRGAGRGKELTFRPSGLLSQRNGRFSVCHKVYKIGAQLLISITGRMRTTKITHCIINN